MANDRIDQKAVDAFHVMWDHFPGHARLITNRHEIIASNALASDAGFSAGGICAKVNSPSSHIGCKMAKMFQEGMAQTDTVIDGKIRGWVPVEGYADLCVHFTLEIPKKAE